MSTAILEAKMKGGKVICLSFILAVVARASHSSSSSSGVAESVTGHVRLDTYNDKYRAVMGINETLAGNTSSTVCKDILKLPKICVLGATSAGKSW